MIEPQKNLDYKTYFSYNPLRKAPAYLAYYDSSSATASQRKFKYVATSDLSMDDTMLRDGNGYWLYANEAGNLTLPGVGGSYSNETYAWDRLRFVNSSGSEKSASDAKDEGWAHSWYYYGEVCEARGCSNELIPVTNYSNFTLSPWQGYFTKSNYDNITLIRQN